MTAPGRPPVEPSAAMRTAARALHEMFVALINEDFTEQQAMYILGVSISASFNNREDPQ